MLEIAEKYGMSVRTVHYIIAKFCARLTENVKKAGFEPDDFSRGEV